MLHSLSQSGRCATSMGIRKISQAAFSRSYPDSCNTDAQRSSRGLQYLPRSAAQCGQKKRLCQRVPGLHLQAWQRSVPDFLWRRGPQVGGPSQISSCRNRYSLQDP
eukprot:3119036-Pyramimonas_sp.AAC.1